MTPQLSDLEPAELLVTLGLSQAAAAIGWRVAMRIQTIGHDASPYPAEREVTARAVASRRHEFASGRAAARRALTELGRAVEAIGRRPDRSPDWPEGVIGSISHAGDLVVAVVAAGPTSGSGSGGPGQGRAPAGLGIDLEPDGALPSGVAERILSPAERDAPGTAAESPDPVVVFSAKESVFKALNPLTGRWLEFEEVSIRFDGPTFEATLAGPDRPSTVTGGWTRRAGFVMTSCVVARD